MNAWNMPQQYPQAQAQGFNQIVRRPLTDVERQLGSGYYKKLQQGVRGMAVFSLVLFVVYSFLLPGLSDPIMYDSLSMVLTIFMVVIGIAAIGISLKSISTRTKISEVMRDGMGVEVTAPAYRTQGMQKVPSWSVGPISLMSTRELAGIMQEGAPTCVLCLPRLKIAIAVNNFGLRHGAPIISPPNLEAMAVPVGQIGMAPVAQPSWAGPAAYAPSSPQVQAYIPPPTEEEPPPPPDY